MTMMAKQLAPLTAITHVGPNEAGIVVSAEWPSAMAEVAAGATGTRLGTAVGHDIVLGPGSDVIPQ